MLSHLQAIKWFTYGRNWEFLDIESLPLSSLLISHFIYIYWKSLNQMEKNQAYGIWFSILVHLIKHLVQRTSQSQYIITLVLKGFPVQCLVILNKVLYFHANILPPTNHRCMAYDPRHLWMVSMEVYGQPWYVPSYVWKCALFCQFHQLIKGV